MRATLFCKTTRQTQESIASLTPNIMLNMIFFFFNCCQLILSLMLIFNKIYHLFSSMVQLLISHILFEILKHFLSPQDIIITEAYMNRVLSSVLCNIILCRCQSLSNHVLSKPKLPVKTNILKTKTNIKITKTTDEIHNLKIGRFSLRTFAVNKHCKSMSQCWCSSQNHLLH